MTRKSHPASSSLGKSLSTIIGLTLAGAAFAMPAQAATITFEGGAGAAYIDGDTYSESGYTFQFLSPFADGAGSLVGANIDGSDPSWCQSMACPTGTSGAYYGALNDSLISILSDSGNPFRLQGFDASFIGHTNELGGYMSTVGLIEVRGLTADGAVLSEDFWLGGPGQNGFSFANFAATTMFDNAFTELLMIGYACTADGFCRAYQSNAAQFGIDNMVLVADDASEVPEPASGLLLGIGLMGLLARARRRTA
ncbi:NF038120 family PEP-CTERM protein [Telluria beijingensis]|uniref:NF038120 family PEP-CTERM protein n=1 Tax=Telluria beijingensis TaxID=3068633 RepID=UPI0027953464|nr:NF038120 family PEP-CTERM protein [Massilia sp. REN29]